MKRNLFVLLVLLISNITQAAIDTDLVTEYRDNDTVYQRNFNIRINPIATMIGMPTLSLQYAINDTISLGVGGMYMTSDETIKDFIEAGDPFFNRNEYEISAQSVNLRGDFAIDGQIMEDTYVFSAIISNQTVKVENVFFNEIGKAEALLGTLLVGYQWMWEHFNINLAGGINTAISEKYSFENVTGVDDSDVDGISTGFALEFGMGIAF